MEKLRQLARPTSYFVLLCVLGLGTHVPAAQAAIIGTEAASAATQLSLERDRVNRLLGRAEVKTYLRAQGVDPASVQARVDALTDAEIRQLADRLDAYPAGEGFGTVLTIAFLVFLTLLVTDILGYTDVFPFVKKSGK